MPRAWAAHCTRCRGEATRVISQLMGCRTGRIGSERRGECSVIALTFGTCGKERTGGVAFLIPFLCAVLITAGCSGSNGTSSGSQTAKPVAVTARTVAKLPDKPKEDAEAKAKQEAEIRRQEEARQEGARQDEAR